MRELKMMFRLLRASTKAQVMYRADFLIGVVGTLFYNGAFIASVGIITGRFRDIGGWGMWEILLLYSLFELGHSVYGFFFKNMTMLSRHVMEGTLDVYFLRPYGILTQLNGAKMDYTAFMDTVIGIAGFAVAYAQLDLAWAVWQWGLLILFMVCDGVIEYALAMAMNCASIVFLNARSLFGAYFQLVLISQRYPLNIFATGFQAILTFVFPLGFMNYYPAMLLLGKPGGWAGWFTPLVAALFGLLSMLVFRGAIKHYTSTGS